MSRRSHNQDDEYTLTERLDLYVARVEELIRTRAVREGALGVEMNMNFGINRPFSVTHLETEEETLKSFLLSFRPFISKGEPVFVNSVYSACWPELRSNDLKHRMVRGREHWTKSAKNGPFRLVVNNEHLSPEHLTDLWINGQYFHNDKRKAKKIEQLDPMGTIFARQAFINHLITATNYVIDIAQVVVIGRAEGLLD